MATAEELWAAAARSALAAEDEEEEGEVEIADGDDMAVEEEAVAEGITPEEVEVEADVVDDPPAMAVTAEEVEIDVEATPAPPPPRPRQPRPEAPRPQSPWVPSSKGGKAGGKGWKGPQAPPVPKGKGKGGKGRSETFYGLVHQVGEKTGNMLVKSWKVSEQFGQEAMIPKLANPANAVLGDKISFEVMERPDGARPLAVNVTVRGHIDLSAQPGSAPPAELRRQVLYYLSDDNLRTDRFFQDIIASNEGGWISMSVILGCPRMKQMKATSENVFAALRDCPEVELQEAAGEEAIRRTSPPPPLEAPAAKEWGGGSAKGRGKGRGAGPGAAALTPAPPAPPAPSSSATAPVSTPPPTVAKAATSTPPPAPTPTPTPTPAPAPASAAEEEEATPGAVPADSEPSGELYYVGLVKSQMRMEPRKFFITSDEITKVYSRDAYFLPNQQPKGVEVGSLVVFSVPADAEVGFSPHASFVGRLAPLGSLGRGDAQEPQKNGDIAKAPGVQKTIIKKGGGR